MRYVRPDREEGYSELWQDCVPPFSADLHIFASHSLCALSWEALPGPGMTTDNFSFFHLRNREHRERVDAGNTSE
jgi:hypothetical protein